jgi:hypothetical protein
MELHAIHELRNGYSQCLGENRDVPQRYISSSPLNAADIGAIQSAIIRECFLRKTAILSQQAHTFAKSKKDIVASNHHGCSD